MRARSPKEPLSLKKPLNYEKLDFSKLADRSIIGNMEPWIPFLPGGILLVACVDDLRTKKIHNKLIVFLLPVVLLAVFLLGGIEALKMGGLSAVLAFCITVPLFLLRVIGGGDVKLLILIAFTLSWDNLLWISLVSLPWALILGLVKITLDKKLKDFLWNILFLFRHRTSSGLKFHNIPYSIALFFAWLSFISLKVAGVS